MGDFFFIGAEHVVGQKVPIDPNETVTQRPAAPRAENFISRKPLLPRHTSEKPLKKIREGSDDRRVSLC
jgi:hypothetical protein